MLRRAARARDVRSHRAHGGAAVRRVARRARAAARGRQRGRRRVGERASPLARRFAPIIVQLPARAADARERRARRLAAAAPDVAPAVDARRAGPSSSPRPRAPRAPASTCRFGAVASRPRSSSPTRTARAARRRTRLALRRYAELRHAFPGSREEITSRVVVGDLLLAEGSRARRARQLRQLPRREPGRHARRGGARGPRAGAHAPRPPRRGARGVDAAPAQAPRLGAGRARAPPARRAAVRPAVLSALMPVAAAARRRSAPRPLRPPATGIEIAIAAARARGRGVGARGSSRSCWRAAVSPRATGALDAVDRDEVLRPAAQSPCSLACIWIDLGVARRAARSSASRRRRPIRSSSARCRCRTASTRWRARRSRTSSRRRSRRCRPAVRWRRRARRDAVVAKVEPAPPRRPAPAARRTRGLGGPGRGGGARVAPITSRCRRWAVAARRRPRARALAPALWLQGAGFASDAGGDPVALRFRGGELAALGAIGTSPHGARRRAPRPGRRRRAARDDAVPGAGGAPRRGARAAQRRSHVCSCAPLRASSIVCSAAWACSPSRPATRAS